MSRVLLIIFLFLTCEVPAQLKTNHKPSIAYITAKDFALSDEFGYLEPWDIETDSLGYAFFAQRHIHRFNGRKIEKLAGDSAKNTERYYGLQKNHGSQIWLEEISNGLSNITNDTIHQYRFNSQLKPFYGHTIERFYVDRFDTLYFAPRGVGYLRITPAGELQEIIGIHPEINGFVLTELPDGTFFHFSVIQPGLKKKPLSVYYLHSDGRLVKVTETDSYILRYKTNAIRSKDSSWILSMGNEILVKGKKDSLIVQTKIESYVIDLFQDSRGTLWIGTVNQGLFRSKEGEFPQMEHIIKEGAVAVTAEDINGGLWIKSSEDRFAYMPNQELYRYSTQGGQLKSNLALTMATDYQRVFYLLSDNSIAVLQGDSVYTLDGPKSKHGVKHNRKDLSNITKLYYDKINHQLCAGYWHQLSFWDGKTWTIIPFDTSRIKGRKVYEMQTATDGTFVVLTTNEVVKMIDQQITEILPITPSMGRVRSMTLSDSDDIFLAGDKGVWKWNGGNFVRPIVKGINKELLTKSVGLIKGYANRIWFQTIDDGLFVLHNEEIEGIKGPDGKWVTALGLFVSEDDKMWSRRSGNEVFSLEVLSDSIVYSNFILDDFAAFGGNFWATLAVLEDKVYVGSDQGIFRMSINGTPKESPLLRCNITEVYARHLLLKDQQHYNLPYVDNSIALNFEAISYRLFTPEIRCRLLGLETNWIKPKYNSLQYTNLESGTYKFQVQARILNESWGPLKEVTFLIAIPYWQTWWFRTLVGIAFLILFYLVFRYWMKKEQEKSKIAVEMTRLELKAIKAQLNPHFIFNSITSAMYYLSGGNSEDAESYLQRFSKLIRTVLENSDKTTVPLGEELKLLKHYVALESERFSGEEIQFEVSFESVELDNIQIPPSLFQPYIENAIWHGLQYKDGMRRILVHGKKEEPLLKVVVEDNGIGRRASELKGTGRKEQRSYGMMIASRRIEAFNLKNVEGVKIEDLVDQDGNGVGTRVVFYIPLHIEGASDSLLQSNKFQA